MNVHTAYVCIYIYNTMTTDKQFCIETLLIFLWFVLILFGDIFLEFVYRIHSHIHTHTCYASNGDIYAEKDIKTGKFFLFFLVVVLNELYCHFMTVRAQFHFDNFSVRSTENREMERAAWKIIREKQTAAMWNANYYALTPMILLITFCDKFEFSMELFSFTTIQLLYVVT